MTRKYEIEEMNTNAYGLLNLHILSDNEVQVAISNANYITFGGLLLSKTNNTKASIINQNSINHKYLPHKL